MSTIFKIYDASANEVQFLHDEAAASTTKGYFLIEKGQEKSSGGQIRTQIRPGLRYKQLFVMCLPETKYISFINLINNGSDDYFVEYTNVPTVLSNNSVIETTNNFAIAFDMEEPEMVYGEDIVYQFNLTIYSANLL